MPSLYELVGELGRILQSDELTDADETALDSLFSTVQVKVASIVSYYQGLEGDAEICAGEIARLQKRKAMLIAKAERLKEYTLRCMRQASITEVDVPTMRVKMVQSQPKVIVDNLDAIPERFKIIKEVESIDREKVLAHWSGGFILPVGVQVEQGHHLRVT
jgi:hypothetical protein